MPELQLRYQAEKLKQQVQALMLELAETADALQIIIQDLKSGQNRIDSREVIG